MKIHFLILLLIAGVKDLHSQEVNPLLSAMIRNDSVYTNHLGSSIRIFKSDIVYLTEFNYKECLYSGFIAGDEIKINCKNIVIADSTFNQLASVKINELESLKRKSKELSKKYFDIEYDKAKRYFEKGKTEEVLYVNYIDENFYSQNSKYYFQYLNTSKKKIKSFSLIIKEFADIEGQVLLKKKNFKLIVSNNDKFGCHTFKSKWNKSTKLKMLSELTITYIDGTVSNVSDVEYFPKEWLYMLTGEVYKECN